LEEKTAGVIGGGADAEQGRDAAGEECGAKMDGGNLRVRTGKN
jgi:hypothetical protein